ncbi:hypothetical protein CYMTET_46078 [Cymbomonas tetramitiformis]|uniref:Uncharacterized protein n=1 Tax=Cymbomonas tetramitiformis TaxID=36881 RepID=A0AAE0BYX8_9CHLO|nr:hypothetical protein CYMTET_46078 [Cymbomonas tetramitiformis]
MSTLKQLQRGVSLITVCDKNMLGALLHAFKDKPFVSLVIDDPLPLVGDPLKPLCQRVFFLSANTTELVSELASLNRPHIYEHMFNAKILCAEQQCFQIRDNLCLPATGTITKEVIDKQLDSIRGNVRKQAYCVMDSFFFDWMIKEMAELTPATVVKFPLMDRYENKIGRSFFSAVKRYQDYTVSVEDNTITFKRDRIVCFDGVTPVSDETLSQLLAEHVLVLKVCRGRKKPKHDKKSDEEQMAVNDAGADADEGLVTQSSQQYVLGSNCHSLIAGHVTVSVVPVAAAEGRRVRGPPKTTQEVTYIVPTNRVQMIKPVANQESMEQFLQDMSLDTSDTEFKNRVSAIKTLITRRQSQNHSLMCTRCGWGFDESDYCVRLCRAKYQRMICPSCGYLSPLTLGNSKLVDFDKVVYQRDLHRILNSELSGQDLQSVIQACEANWKSVTSSDLEYPSFKYLFLLIGSLIRNDPIVKRILLYVTDDNRATLRLLANLLSELLCLETRQYYDQPVSDSSMADLLEPATQNGESSKKRKLTKQADMEQRRVKMSSNLAWFNTMTDKPKLLFLSSDSSPTHQEVYGFDARRADCTIFVDFPKNRTQAVARGLRMSPNPIDKHLVIYM